MKRWLLGSLVLLVFGSACYFFGYARGSAAIAPENEGLPGTLAPGNSY